MSRRLPARRALVLAALAGAGCAAALAQSAPAASVPAPMRRTVTILKDGREAARLDVPPGAELTFEAQHISEGERSRHATGHVVVGIESGGRNLATLTGDEAFLEREPMTAADAATLADLDAMAESDQRHRRPGMSADDWTLQNALDAANQARLAAIVARRGWPGVRFAGLRGSRAAFLVVQHAPIDFQQRYLPLLRAAVAQDEASAADLALLEDRVLMHTNRAQRYGSQLQGEPPVFWPIEDGAHVDERRAAAGLEPLAEYAKYFGAAAVASLPQALTGRLPAGPK